jgi:hypothetical protein
LSAHDPLVRSVVVRVVVLLALTAGAAAAATSRPTVSMLSLPSGVGFYSVQLLGNRVLLSGEEASGQACDWLVVDRDLGVESPLPSGNCDRPPVAAEPVVAVQLPVADSNDSAVRIARPSTTPSSVSYGPVVMTFNEASDTKLEWTYGPGRLWLYDVAALHGTTGPPRAEVLAVSTTTGRVVQTASMPRLYRPLLAADSDGLWIAASPESGTGLAPTYFLAAGAHAPRLVHRGGYAAFWIVASGHSVWEDIASTTLPASTVRQEIWRYDGRSAGAHRLASADDLEVLTPALQPDSAALWTIASPQFGHGRSFTCTDQQIVTIDPLTGRQTIVTTIRLPGSPCDPEPGAGSLPYGGNSQMFTAGAFYFLVDGLTQATLLYRVAP